MQIRPDEFSIPFFKENGFIRKRCKDCGSYYWTQDPESPNCGDSPCQEYTFLGKPPTKRSYDIDQMRKRFLSFFKKNEHTVILPYPIIARWRDDVYLVGASIFDFQPYVTEGILPPPANPLVVSQPCLRFTDLDNVGPTAGRHLVIFEMGGAHAFNRPEREVYWKDDTIRLHHELLTEELGVRSETVQYKEHFWSGGGNAGPDVEACVAGLEISTLVFMSYKTVNEKLVEMPIKTVDTGYGIERWSWLSQGSISGFHAIYSPILERILRYAGIKVEDDLVLESTRLSGVMSFETHHDRVQARRRIADRLEMDWRQLDKSLSLIESAYTAADHTKALVFMLSEGVVPSNVEEGYLTRLLIRRSYRMLRHLGIEDRLLDITGLQITRWSKSFPHLKEMRDEILEALSVEEEKYKKTLERGREEVRRISRDLTSKGVKALPADVLVDLYDSHGIVPEMVREFSQDIEVEVPDNFFSMVASRHMESQTVGEPQPLDELKGKVEGIPPTRTVYYEDDRCKSFKAKSLKVIDGRHVVLDSTCFYPEGGGQVNDRGTLRFKGHVSKVVDVQRVDHVIVHTLEGRVPREGEEVEGDIDWERRLSLMRHHTATHLLIGAARRLLGEHAWQSGAKKEEDKSRLDISHYRHLEPEEVEKLEMMATEIASQNIPVEVAWMPRTEAEQHYGFRIYQGGAVPGKDLRIIKIGDWDVEACGGTHCRSTGEVGLVKILKTERPQDGVERLIFATGPQALKHIQNDHRILIGVSSLLGSPLEDLTENLGRLLERERSLRRRLEELRLKRVREEVETAVSKPVMVEGVRLVVKERSEGDEEEIILLTSRIVEDDPEAVAVVFLKGETARIFVSAGEKAVEMGVHAGRLASDIAGYVGGGGGGKPYFGQGGGPDVRRVEEAVAAVEDRLRGYLKDAS